jgi:type III secretion system FlhB-like substrate exporter
LQAPKVLAKGRNLMAQRIKDEARWAGVPIVENPPLARSLFRSVEPGQSIPHDLYAAVAAILAFLYRQRVEEKTRASAREPRRAQTAPRRGNTYEPPRLQLGPGIKKSRENMADFGTTDAEASATNTTMQDSTRDNPSRDSASANRPAIEEPGAGQ